MVGKLYKGKLFGRETFDVIAELGQKVTIDAGATAALDLTLGDEGE